MICLCSRRVSGIASLSVVSTHSSAALLSRQRRKEYESKQVDKVQAVDGSQSPLFTCCCSPAGGAISDRKREAETQTRRHSNWNQLGRDHSSGREPHLGGAVGPTQVWRGGRLREGVADPRQRSGLRGGGSAEGQKRGCLAAPYTKKTTSYFSGNAS